MSKTLRPATIDDARKATDAAQKALEGTDAIVLVLMIARDDNGMPEVFAPCASPEQFDRGLLKAIVAGYSDGLQGTGERIEGVQSFMTPMPPHYKGTVN